MNLTNKNNVGLVSAIPIELTAGYYIDGIPAFIPPTAEYGPISATPLAGRFCDDRTQLAIHTMAEYCPIFLIIKMLNVRWQRKGHGRTCFTIFKFE